MITDVFGASGLKGATLNMANPSRSICSGCGILQSDPCSRQTTWFFFFGGGAVGSWFLYVWGVKGKGKGKGEGEGEGRWLSGE